MRKSHAGGKSNVKFPKANTRVTDGFSSMRGEIVTLQAHLAPNAHCEKESSSNPERWPWRRKCIWNR